MRPGRKRVKGLTAEGSRIVAFRVPTAEYKRIKAEAKRRGVSMGDVIREELARKSSGQ